MDIALAAVLLLAAIIGAVRGLYRSLAGLLVLVLAIAGAGWLTETCAAGVEECIRPALTERMERLVGDAVRSEAENAAPEMDSELFSSAEALLERFGWEGDLAETVREGTESALRSAEEAVAAALVESLLPAMVSTMLKTVFFLLLLFALTLLSRLARPLFERLPVVRQCNTLLGAAAGLIQGVLAAFLLVWFARCLGFLPEAETLNGTFLLRLFIR
ncbi:MAG: CvpA family protein [Oscillospiraceae bacterium]